MNIFESIEKLINEHGSATILKERLSLAADQYSVLEKQIIDFKSKIQTLESENQSLKLNKKQLIQKIQDLEKIIHDKSLSIDEISKNILILISNQNNNSGLTTDKIAQSLKINLQVAIHYLDELYNKKFISEQGGSINIMSCDSTSGYWYLEPEGRRYLINNKLI